jgi:UPF0176 protein
MNANAQPLLHNAPYDVVALYAFTPINDPVALQAELRVFAPAEKLCGTLIIAHEGFNGTLAGPRAGLDRLVARMTALLAPGRQAEVKFSHASERPFWKLKIKVKREIVTLGLDGIDPSSSAGTYVKPADWNALISDPDTVVIDTRNSYEIAVGTFENAVDPATRLFSEFPKWVEENREKLAGKRLAMFCTGGIRCEKATALMKAEGFDDVHHLQGGILRYLENVPPEQSLWKGDCVVFDKRVVLGHGLVEGLHINCPNCGTPIAATTMDMSKPHCPDCIRASLSLGAEHPSDA